MWPSPPPPPPPPREQGLGAREKRDRPESETHSPLLDPGGNWGPDRSPTGGRALSDPQAQRAGRGARHQAGLSEKGPLGGGRVTRPSHLSASAAALPLRCPRRRRRRTRHAEPPASTAANSPHCRRRFRFWPEVPPFPGGESAEEARAEAGAQRPAFLPARCSLAGLARERAAEEQSEGGRGKGGGLILGARVSARPLGGGVLPTPPTPPLQPAQPLSSNPPESHTV